MNNVFANLRLVICLYLSLSLTTLPAHGASLSQIMLDDNSDYFIRLYREGGQEYFDKIVQGLEKSCNVSKTNATPPDLFQETQYWTYKSSLVYYSQLSIYLSPNTTVLPSIPLLNCSVELAEETLIHVSSYWSDNDVWIGAVMVVIGTLSGVLFLTALSLVPVKHLCGLSAADSETSPPAESENPEDSHQISLDASV